jgi:hypothetical protein
MLPLIDPSGTPVIEGGRQSKEGLAALAHETDSAPKVLVFLPFPHLPRALSKKCLLAFRLRSVLPEDSESHRHTGLRPLVAMVFFKPDAPPPYASAIPFTGGTEEVKKWTLASITLSCSRSSTIPVKK